MPINPAQAPLATYRLQLRKEFPFSMAAGLAPYLREIGISHCYCSPILMSGAGSTHGYDVNDYHRIDPELGGGEGFAELARALRHLELRLLLDFVPNHMGIQGAQNRWWRDVLEAGPNSPQADFFDIDWADIQSTGRSQVLAPLLADQFGVVLEQGKLALHYQDGGFEVRYEDLVLPLSAATYAQLLGAAAEQAGNSPAVTQELRVYAEEFYRVADPITPQPGGGSEQRSELKRRLARTVEESAGMRRALETLLQRTNGEPGTPASFDALENILNEQHYRLAHWRTGAHEVNYRRFFAIDTLIGLRMENPLVFEETHRLIGGLIRAGLIAGLRIDHIDGLRNPQEYLERVQALAHGPENSGGVPLCRRGENIGRGRETRLFVADRRHDSIRIHPPSRGLAGRWRGGEPVVAAVR